MGDVGMWWYLQIYACMCGFVRMCGAGMYVRISYHFAFIKFL